MKLCRQDPILGLLLLIVEFVCACNDNVVGEVAFEGGVEFVW